MKLQQFFKAALAFFGFLHFTSSWAQTIPFRSISQAQTTANRTINTNEWTTGAMPDTTGSGTPTTTILRQLIIPNANLQSLGVTLGGPKIIVSNNPERFTGDGWLYQHSFTDPTQGGVDYPISGTARIYMFHINYTSPAATKYISLVVHNPGASAVTYSRKGSHYTNVDYPLTGAATGQSYWVSRDWLSNTPATTSGTINAGSKLIVFTKQMNSGNMFDGLYEITTSGPVYYYVVVTSSNVANTVRNAAAVNTPYASFAMPPDPRVTQSDYRQETGGTYARQAGVYTNSTATSDNTIVIPNVPSRIGFCFNTASKFYPMLENQNSPIIVKTPPTTDTVRSINASSQSYGNYGMYYDVMFRMQNSSSVTKTVKVYMAGNENLVNAASSSGSWNSRININGTNVDVYNQFNNPRKLIGTFNIPAGTTNIPIQVYVPGLITTNHQLIFETTTTVAGTLPVNLTSFEGKYENGVNLLKWKTEQELNFSHYIVERKINEGIFQSIAKVPAENNGLPQHYFYNDATASVNGKKYYRLKMVNTDSTYKYSSVVAIDNKADKMFKAAGNPFREELRLQWNAQQSTDAMIKISTSNGTMVYAKALKSNQGFNQFVISQLQHLKPGTYVVELLINDHPQTITVIKQ
jgi:hypothetical protein